MRVAGPPVDGSVQMLPCRSTARVRPSGDTATDIDVPSWTMTSTSDVVDARWPPSGASAVKARTIAVTNHVRRTIRREDRSRLPGNQAKSLQSGAHSFVEWLNEQTQSEAHYENSPAWFG